MTEEANRAASYLCSLQPEVGRTTMGRADLKSLLLDTGGWLLVGGRMCDIKSENLGAGVYRVWMEDRHADAS